MPTVTTSRSLSTQTPLLGKEHFLFPAGDPSEAELELIRTRKPERPVLSVTMGDGSTRRVWCTFGEQQIDIDPFSEPGASVAVQMALLLDVLADSSAD